METKRGNSLAFHLFSTHHTVLLLIITGALAKVYCGENLERFTRLTNTMIGVNDRLHRRRFIFSRIGLFCYLLFDKPAILGSNTCIYSEACWNFFPRPSKALLANGVVSVCKLNSGDSDLVVFSAGLSCSLRSEPACVGTERKTQNRHSSADRNDWALSEVTVPQCAAWSIGTGEGGAPLASRLCFLFNGLRKQEL